VTQLKSKKEEILHAFHFTQRSLNWMRYKDINTGERVSPWEKIRREYFRY